MSNPVSTKSLLVSGFLFVAVLLGALTFKYREVEVCRPRHGQEVFQPGPARISTFCDESGAEHPMVSLLREPFNPESKRRAQVIEKLTAGERVVVLEFDNGRESIYAKVKAESGSVGWVKVARLEKPK